MQEQSDFSSMRYRLFTFVWLLVFTLLLAGCQLFSSGGSDSGSATNPPSDTPSPAANQPPDARFSATPSTGEAPLQVSFDASASTDADGSIASYVWDFGDGATATGVSTSYSYTTEGRYTASLTVTDNEGASSTASQSINVTAMTTPPPDPATIAPPIDGARPVSVFDTTAFLYTGDNPVQRGVAEGTIVQRRAAVLRGKVTGRDGQPLSGVTVTILDHPELGLTLSRDDGLFDLVVNGGGQLTVNYRKVGYLSIQRRIEAPWNDYAWLPDVTLVALSAESAPLDLASTEPVQVVQGQAVSDDRGSRRTTLLVPQGVNAQMVMPGGGTRAFSDTQLTVRVTEYTVGDSGPEAMPGALPPGVAYTYAVELSVDEALDAGASSVRFDKPLYQYVENFVGFPVGDVVPHYYYNREAGRWERAEHDGVVIQILDIGGGVASIDADGDGVPEDAASLAVLGAVNAELVRLASLYQAGDTLWRVPVKHFSPHDLNWYQARQQEVEDSFNQVDVTANEDASDPCASAGSIIECQNQVLGERIPVVGTPFTLNYRSARTPGFRANNTLKIPLFGNSLPTGIIMQGVRVIIDIAGQRSEAEYVAEANLVHRYTWDGLDGYGRPVPGLVTAHIGIEYRYTSPYLCGTSPCPDGYLPRTTRIVREAVLGSWDARGVGLGGWTLQGQHTAIKGTLFQGDGRNRRSELTRQLDATLVAGDAGDPSESYDGDGGPAVEAGLDSPRDVAMAPDGTLYIADTDNDAIRRVDPLGVITTYAGRGNGCTWRAGDDGSDIEAPDRDIYGWWSDAWCTGAQATNVRLYRPGAIALGRDGSLYVAGVARILRIWPDGRTESIVGTGERGFSGDGGPATEAQIYDGTQGLEVGPDGSVYIADTSNHRIRKVGPDGIIRTIAGSGDVNYGGFTGDGGPATEAELNRPYALALGPDGSLYIADSYNHRVRRITPDGIIDTVAGVGQRGRNGDGGPATEAQVGRPVGLAVARDGTLFIASGYSPSSDGLRRVAPDGIISTIPLPRAFDDDDGPAGMDIGPDGALYVAGNDDDDEGYSAVYKLARVLPEDDREIALMASDQRGEIYRFERGRHVATLSFRNGVEQYRFGYDDAGWLATVTDASGNVTTIEHDGAGNPVAIVAASGQRTELNVDDNGFLASVANPQNERWDFVYGTDGLLLQSSDPNGNVSTYRYDDTGRLVENVDPAGGGNTLVREAITNGYQVTRTSARGVEATYSRQDFGDYLYYYNTGSQGSSSTRVSTDGVRSLTLPDGSALRQSMGNDPRRFRGQAPYVASVDITTPGGHSFARKRYSYSTLSDWNDPLSVTLIKESIQLRQPDTSGNLWSSFGRRFDVVSGEETFISATGRRALTRYDSLGRVVSRRTLNQVQTDYTYDDLGRLFSVTTGTGSEARSYVFDYRNDNTLATITDPLDAVTTLNQDAAGRVTGMNLPGGRSLGFSYDANGNLTGLTTPNDTRHAFTYSGINRVTAYTPPGVSGSGSVGYIDNLDRQRTRINRADGRSIDFAYDGRGRLSGISVGNDNIAITWAPDSNHIRTIATADGGELGVVYDGSLLTSSEWRGAVAGRVEFDYGPRFELISSTVDGVVVDYGHDQDGLLTSAGDQVLTRDIESGLLVDTSLGNISDSRGYNTFGELVDYAASYGTTGLYSASYQRDKLGRITEKVETLDSGVSTYSYAYDQAGRLSEVRKDGSVVESYDYDLNGNRTDVTNGAGTTSASFDAQDRMTTQGAASYSYSPDGELASRTVGSATTRYAYDTFGNLLQVDLPDGRSMSYLVDGMNRRIGKSVNGVLQQGWLYRDRLNPIAELDAAGNVVSRFVYASRSNVPDYMIKGGVNYRIISDHLGSVRLVVNASDGSIAQRIDYDAYGLVLSDSNPGFQPFGFAGGLYDLDTGLVRFGARDYDPETGRWTAKDPILFRAGAINLYSYVSGDPVNGSDPTGLLFVPPTSLQDAAIMLAVNAASADSGAGAIGDAIAGVTIDAIGVIGNFVVAEATGTAVAVGTGAVSAVVGSFAVGVGVGTVGMNLVQYITGYDPANILSDLLLPDDDLTALINADAVLCP